MASIIVIGLLLVFVGLSTVWVWFSVLFGMREPTVFRTIFLLLSLFSLSILVCFSDVTGDPFSYFLTLFIWPIVWFYAVPKLIAAKVIYFLASTLLILAGTLALALMTTRIRRVLIVAAGSVLAVLAPAVIENSVIKTQMASKAEASGLLIVSRSSFYRSASEGFSEFKNPHGYACDANDWPSLWSYKYRDWIPLPPNSRYGGGKPELIKSYCSHHRRLLADSA